MEEVRQDQPVPSVPPTADRKKTPVPTLTDSISIITNTSDEITGYVYVNFPSDAFTKEQFRDMLMGEVDRIVDLFD